MGQREKRVWEFPVSCVLVLALPRLNKIHLLGMSPLLWPSNGRAILVTCPVPSITPQK